jgi:UDP-N-acetylglucosamine:LPS N-acetylglucosamine transferase
LEYREELLKLIILVLINGRVTKINKKIKICFISAAGGHFEQIKQLSSLALKYDCYYVINKVKDMISSEKKLYLIKAPSLKNKFRFFYGSLLSFIQQIFIFFKENPSLVITTGAGFVLPTCFLAHIFKKKLIYIETFAKMSSPSKIGVYIYENKLASLFLIQHKESFKYFPNSTYAGWIY